MNICEIFYSLQGESTYAGLPCIFIRLAGCNLRCKYCDTPQCYEDGKEQTIEDILDEISPYNCKLIEITGGEPLLQVETIELMESLHKAGYKILLETNGSQSIQPVPSFVHIIIDVKLPGSGHPQSFLRDSLLWLKPGWDEIKFVVSDRADFDSAFTFIKLNNLTEHILLVSPVAEKLTPSVLADWIKQSDLPLRLNLQLHKFLAIK